MSGHSKWSTIKRQKGANDAKRGKLFTKLSNAITFAVKAGGGVTDLNGNPRLRFAVDAARNANMPKENIQRAIERATAKQSNDVTEVIYEGFGPGGFSVIIEAITDNKQRTTPEIKLLFDKYGGTLGVPGSVHYQFARKGHIIIPKQGKTLDDIFLIAAEAGAEDIEEGVDEFSIYTSPDDLAKVRDALLERSIEVSDVELLYKPIVIKELAPSDIPRAVLFLEKLEDHDAVQKVYANFEIPEIEKQELVT